MKYRIQVTTLLLLLGGFALSAPAAAQVESIELDIAGYLCGF